MDKKQKLLRNNAFQTVLASLICIAIGLLIGYIVLLIINPAGAGKAIVAIMKNFFYYPNAAAAAKYFGTTLIKASALLMCALSVLFAYKAGLFNIGAAGQYVVGARPLSSVKERLKRYIKCVPYLLGLRKPKYVNLGK